jgi:integrase
LPTHAGAAMRGITVKYLVTDKRTGRYVYRRRVPECLKGQTSRREFTKALGESQAIALGRYGAYHQEIEHLIALARNGVAGLSPIEQQKALAATLKLWGADPYSPGLDDNERTWRQVAADGLLDPYQDNDTGEWRGVPEGIGLEATALLQGVDIRPTPPTITDAFKFYLEEKRLVDPEKRTKQVQRFRRVERSVLAVVGADKPIAGLTREDARAWRDARTGAGVASSTVKRERNDISTVIQTAISELTGAGRDNPFKALRMPKPEVAAQDTRLPLPLTVIEGVYAALVHKPDLLMIWTLLDFTGARPSEKRQLKASEVVLSAPIPHIIIQAREGRSLKTAWSNRKVPLVGAALSGVTALLHGQNDIEADVFPHFAGEGGMDSLSEALVRRVRKITDSPLHTPYSLRHNMKDRLRAAEVPEQAQLAILGHALGKGAAGSYGGEFSLEVKHKGLLRALEGYREVAPKAD